jgi:hypothetical protein
MYRLIHSPFGLTLRGIKDSESRMELAGIMSGCISILCSLSVDYSRESQGSYTPSSPDL